MFSELMQLYVYGKTIAAARRFIKRSILSRRRRRCIINILLANREITDEKSLRFAKPFESL